MFFCSPRRLCSWRPPWSAPAAPGKTGDEPYPTHPACLDKHSATHAALRYVWNNLDSKTTPPFLSLLYLNIRSFQWFVWPCIKENIKNIWITKKSWRGYNIIGFWFAPIIFTKVQKSAGEWWGRAYLCDKLLRRSAFSGFCDVQPTPDKVWKHWHDRQRLSTQAMSGYWNICMDNGYVE